LGGYTEEEIEGKFITAMVLRSEFDVSHVSLSLLTRGQLAVLHRYTRVAEPAFRDLLKRVIARVSDGTYSLLPDTDEGLGHEKQAILDRIDRNTQGLD
jgi:hypothetical protein